MTNNNILGTDNLVAVECPICVDMGGGRKPEYPEKNPQSTEEINCRNSLA